MFQTLWAPFLFIIASICKTSKISVICKLASHLSPFKTLIGLAMFTGLVHSPGNALFLLTLGMRSGC